MTSGRSSSVAKAVELMDVVARSAGRGATLHDLAEEAGVAVSTAHRYATSLEDQGMLARDGAGRYRLGIRLVALASHYLEDDPVRAAARPFLVELVALTGETAHLGVLDGNELVYIDKVESDRSVRLVSQIGGRMPLHCTSLGKAMLSMMTPAARAALLTEPLSRPTEKTRVGAALEAELEQVRIQGFALDDEENEEGVRCFGVPIVNAAGQPIAAISVSAPASRFSVEDCHRFAPTAQQFAAQIGGRQAPAADRIS